LGLQVRYVTSWSADVNGKRFFRGDGNRLKFLGYLAEGVERFEIKESTSQRIRTENELVGVASNS
jgi:hypothetical protein